MSTLTDYHVHLRPDDITATPDEYFTAANIERYLSAAAEVGVTELGCAVDQPDDVPDGDPEVCVTGFGMEDAHSVANSLTFGPDGWL